jgi:acyl-CoA synthetase (NDP forming)
VPGPSARAAIDALLRPRSIAVVGATERLQYGGRLVANLLSSGYAGQIVPVNPNRETVMGLPCYPSLSAAPCLVDLAAIVIPAAAVPAALAECAALAIPAALVISAGFAEVEGAEGLALQQRMLAAIQPAGPRLCGPNCLGVANLADRVWATANVLAPLDDRLGVGGVAVISQSGATAFGPLLAIARDRAIGLRYVVSSGNEADLTTADFVEYMVADRAVTAIACVLEGVRDAPTFRRAIEAALAADKPVVLLKLGRSPVGAAAALSHTAAMTGRDDVFEAMVRQYGLARADDWDELLELADLLGRARRPRGPAVGVVSHSGGIGGLVADHCNALGLPVPELAPATRAALGAILAGRGAARNPADVTGHYAQETFSPILAAMLADPAIDALAVATAGSEAVALRIAGAADASDRPVVVCWTGGLEETDGLRALRASGLPIVYEPSRCARGLAALSAWTAARARLAEPLARGRDPGAWAAATDALTRAGRDPLPEHVGLALLERAGLLAARGVAIADPTQAAARVEAAGLRYPLVAKVDSPDVLHKTDVGGLELGLLDPTDLRSALRRIGERVQAARPDARWRGVLLQETAPPGLEVVLGFHHDDQLGPVAMLGLGGARVEAVGEPTWRLLPLRRADAEAMIGEVRGLPRLLAGYRGLSTAAGRVRMDRDALLDALLTFAGWCHELAGDLASAEVNPLIVQPAGGGAVAVDCLIVPAARRRPAPTGSTS